MEESSWIEHSVPSAWVRFSGIAEIRLERKQGYFSINYLRDGTITEGSAGPSKLWREEAFVNSPIEQI